MKKNIALFMAGAMAMSTLPFNVFAASENSISNLFVSSSDVEFTSATAVSDAPYIKLELKDNLVPGRAFSITLDEAEWDDDYEIYGNDLVQVITATKADGNFDFVVDGSELTITPMNEIAEGSEIRIPIFGKMNGGKAITATIDGGASNITSGTYSLTSQEVDGSLSFSSDADRKLTISEDIAGSIELSDTLSIEIRGSKAQWNTGDVTVADDTRFGYADDAVVSNATNSDDDDILEIDLAVAGVVDNGSGLKGEIELDLTKVLELTDRDYKGVIQVYVWGAGLDEDDKELIDLYDTSNSLEVEVDEVPELIGGRIEQEAAEVTITELYDGSLRDDRYIKFSISGAEFTKEQTIEMSNATGSETFEVEKDSDGNYTEVYIDKDNFEFDSNKLNEITFTPEINTYGMYDGDVTLTVSGPGIVEEVEVVIAEVTSPITVETELTHIKAGFTNIPTADITIKENYAGALEQGEYNIGFISTNNITKGLFVGEVKEETIENDNLEVKIEEDGNFIAFDVLTDSEDAEAGEFTITGIEIYADSTVPTSKYAFELGIYGTGGVEELQTYDYNSGSVGTFDSTDDEVVTYGYVFDYISTGNLDNETDQNSSKATDLNSDVAITLGETSYTVEGTYAGELSAPAYVSNSGSTMIPVRALSVALGVSEDNIFWHQATQTVTIIVSEDRTAQFTLGSDLCTINGIQYPIVSASGATDVVESRNGYTYLPLRFIGEKVFGVTVEWDNATQTATFN